MSKKDILNQQIINKKYKEYNIKLITQIDLINISIQSNNSFNIYQSYFHLKYLNSFKLFISKDIKQIYELICDLIDKNNIEIEFNDKNLKLKLKSIKYPIIGLILKKKNYNSNEVIEKLINEFENIKNENKYLKENNEKLNKRIELIEKENKELKEGKKDDNKTNEIDKNKTSEFERRINILEGFHFIKNKYKIQLTKCDLKNIKSIQPHNNYIYSIFLQKILFLFLKLNQL